MRGCSENRERGIGNTGELEMCLEAPDTLGRVGEKPPPDAAAGDSKAATEGGGIGAKEDVHEESVDNTAGVKQNCFGNKIFLARIGVRTSRLGDMEDLQACVEGEGESDARQRCLARDCLGQMI